MDESYCSHDVYIKGLCGNCGARLEPPQSTSVSMIHSVPELKVSEKLAKKIGRDDQERLIDARKLVLLVDLDQTILHTTHEKVESDPDVHSFSLWPGHPTYYTKLRPYLKEFLERMSKIYELHIFTFGCRKYAHKIASIIDPDQIYFGSRILSRDESADQMYKKGNLNNLFPCGDAMVCIIDDRKDVWKDAGNLIQVKTYSYFKTSISDGAQRRNDSKYKEESEESLDRDADELEALLCDSEEDNDDEDKKDTVECTSEADKTEKVAENGTSEQDDEKSSETEGESSKEQSDSTNESDAPTDGEDMKQEDEDSPENKAADTGENEEPNDVAKESDLPTNKKKKEEDEEDEQAMEKCEKRPRLETEETSTDTTKDKEEKPQSSSRPKDPDDYLLHQLPTTLERIHEKWYRELDEQRIFLAEGENYKLPDIKDVIKRYFRIHY